MLKIYLAAPWSHRRYAAEVAAPQLRADGFTVVSRWHDEWATRGDGDATEPELIAEALKDIEDVQRADAMVVLNFSKSEGKAVEQGLALARRIPIVVVGTEYTHVFQHLAIFELVPDLQTASIILGYLQPKLTPTVQFTCIDGKDFGAG